MSESNVVPIDPQAEEAVFPFQPFEDVICLEQTMEDKSAGGIVLVGKSREFQSGRVVAVGPGRWYSSAIDAAGHHSLGYFVPNTVQVGDYVIYGRYLTGEPVVIAGKKYLLARAGDLAGKSVDGNPLKIRLADPVE